MRAIVILGLLMGWTYCLVGAVVLPAYLLFLAARAPRDRRRGMRRVHAPTSSGILRLLFVYAVVMALCAVALVAAVVWGRPLREWAGEIWSAAAWAALPIWSSLAASVTLVVLTRRRRRGSSAPRSLWGPSSIWTGPTVVHIGDPPGSWTSGGRSEPSMRPVRRRGPGA